MDLKHMNIKTPMDMIVMKMTLMKMIVIHLNSVSVQEAGTM